MYTVPVPEGKFCQDTRHRLGEAIYLLGYLIRAVNWKTGRLCTTRERIAATTGFPERTIVRWLQLLSEAGEITTRRTTRGTLIQINDYASVARTRRVDYTPPPMKPDTARGCSTDVPHAVSRCADDGPTHEPAAARPLSHPRHDRCATGGSTNIRGNMPQSSLPSFVPDRSSSGGEGEAPPSGRSGKPSPGHPLEFDHQWPGLIRATRKRLESLPDDERQRLIAHALEEMSRDPRPFVRIFVTTGPSGVPEPRGKPGEEMMLKVIGDILGQEAAG